VGGFLQAGQRDSVIVVILFGEATMPALPIAAGFAADELRGLARRVPDRSQSLRLIAIANALEGMERGEAARRAGVDIQTMRDWVVRFNVEGPDGLVDRARCGRPPRLSPEQLAQLHAFMKAGPDPERDGLSRWRVVDAIAFVQRSFGVSYSEEGMRSILHGIGLSYQKTRPVHPKSDPAVREAFKKTLRSRSKR